jgi:hypothetical protein
MVVFIILQKFISISFAEEKTASHMGSGLISCKDYIDLVDRDKKRDTNVISQALYSWVQGYMSGMNNMLMTMTKNNNAFADISSMDTEEQKLFLHIFCRKNEDKSLHSAAEALYLKMSKQEK